MEITRQTNQGAGQPIGGQTVALTTDISTTQEIPFNGYSGASLIIPLGSAITGATFYGSDKMGGTYVPVYDSTNTTPVAQAWAALDATSHGYGIQIPDACFAYAALKILVTGGAGAAIITAKG